MTFATLASLLAFNFEWVLHQFFDKKMKLMHAPNGELQSTEDAVNSSRDILPVISPEQQHIRLKALHNVVIAYTFEVGIIFHSESLVCQSCLPCFLLHGMHAYETCLTPWTAMPLYVLTCSCVHVSGLLLVAAWFVFLGCLCL